MSPSTHIEVGDLVRMREWNDHQEEWQDIRQLGVCLVLRVIQREGTSGRSLQVLGPSGTIQAPLIYFTKVEDRERA
jgi:hypothetical protein